MWAAKNTVQLIPTKEINDDNESEGGHPIKKSQFVVQFFILN